MLVREEYICIMTREFFKEPNPANKMKYAKMEAAGEVHPDIAKARYQKNICGSVE